MVAGAKHRLPENVREDGSGNFVCYSEESGETFTLKPQQVRVYEIFAKRPSWPRGFKSRIYQRDGGLSHISGLPIAWSDVQLDHIVSWSDITRVAIDDPEMLLLSDAEIKAARDYLYFEWNNVAISGERENMRKGAESWEEHVKNHKDSAAITLSWVEAYDRERKAWRHR